MKGGISHILLVTASDELEQRLQSFLTVPEFTIRRVPDTGKAMELADSAEFDLLVVDYPPEGPDLRELLRVARWSGALWRTSAAVLLADPDCLEDAESYLDRGVTRILNRHAADDRLRSALIDVTEASPRVKIRGLVRMDLRKVSDRGSVLAQTENVSESGMLIRTDVFLSLGSRFPFSLEIPGLNRPIRGEATVVRLARPATDGLEGFAGRFTRLEGDGEIRLQGLLDEQLRRMRGRVQEP